MNWILAQTPHEMVEAMDGPATQAARLVVEPTYHVAWDKWFTFYSWQIALRSVGTLVLMLLLGTILTSVFRNQLQRYQLVRPTRWAVVALAFYFAIVAGHPYLMTDPYDVLALIIHKSFVAILLVVAVRYLDRLIILPLLTRVSGGMPSRFVHQIVVTIISVFVLAGFCSWAFNIEISSFLAGSAVISIVLGLALQETLGNFFSGMVLQASVPFKTGHWVKIGEIEGRVVEMTWRAVTLLTAGNNHTLIPNSAVSKERIVNYNAPSIATVVTVAVALDYHIPPNVAKRVLVHAALDAPEVLRTPEPTAWLINYEDSSILYKVIFHIDQPENHAAIEEHVRSNLWYRVNQAGMNIPFPVRTVELTDMAQRQTLAAQSARSLRLKAIKAVPMFSALTPELQEQLADGTRDFLLGAGQMLYRQNDPGDSLYILQTGTLGRTIHATEATTIGPGRHIDAGDLSAPALTGEGSALTGKTRGATVRAKTDVRMIEVDQQHLKALFTQDPELMKQFSQAVADRQKEIDEMLKKMGATPPDDESDTQAASILDRMRRLFTFGMR